MRAGVHLMPDASIFTAETGTRHRTADRVARQTGVPVIAVSASMATISLYVDAYRQFVENPDQILARANQALQTLERYRSRLREATTRLSALEVEDQVTVRDVAAVAQRLEMVHRLDLELSEYAAELGTEGRLLALQMHELTTGLTELGGLLEKDYRPGDLTRRASNGGSAPGGAGGRQRRGDLRSRAAVRAEHHPAAGSAAGGPHHRLLRLRPARQQGHHPRLPAGGPDQPTARTLGERLIEHFGSLQALFAASRADLQEVEGVGEQRARAIRDGLVRVAESAYADPRHRDPGAERRAADDDASADDHPELDRLGPVQLRRRPVGAGLRRVRTALALLALHRALAVPGHLPGDAGSSAPASCRTRRASSPQSWLLQIRSLPE